MSSKDFFFSNHAVKQMFARNIGVEDVKSVIEIGEIIKDYPDDKPYPSCLVYGEVNNRPLHVVYSYIEQNNQIIIITAYEPGLDIWENNFKTRKTD